MTDYAIAADNAVRYISQMTDIPVWAINLAIFVVIGYLVLKGIEMAYNALVAIPYLGPVIAFFVGVLIGVILIPFKILGWILSVDTSTDANGNKKTVFKVEQHGDRFDVFDRRNYIAWSAYGHVVGYNGDNVTYIDENGNSCTRNVYGNYV